MPSPFPGMDPFIESQSWEDFHSGLINAIRAALTPCLRPAYVARVEERVYIEHLWEEPARLAVRPDVVVLETDRTSSGGGAAVAERAASETETQTGPALLTLPLPRRIRQAYISIRSRQDWSVVTLIELLSPSNKLAGGQGRREYLDKREGAIASEAHLIEIDLLRGGLRLPTEEPLPPGAFFVFVAREERRPVVEVYSIGLRERLPTIPVPLRAPDPDVRLDLQELFTLAYDRSGYDYSLDYTAPLQPAVSPEDAVWVQNRLSSRVAAA